MSQTECFNICSYTVVVYAVTVMVHMCICLCASVHSSVSVCVGVCRVKQLSDISQYVITACHVTRMLTGQDAEC